MHLSVSLYSNRVTMSFSVDITGFSSDDTEELNFFSMPIEEFNTTLATVSKDENDVQIVVDKAHNKVTFKNETTGTKVSRSVYNATVTIDEAKASITAVDDMREKYLTDPVTLKVTNEVSTFIETIGKIMGLLKSQDAVSLNGTVAKYADQLVVISKTLTNPVSDTEVHLKKQLYDAIKPFLKITDELTVYLTKDFSIAFFESKDLGFKSVLNLEKPRYAFPEDTDLKMALPTEERQVVVKTSKAALKDAFVPFNNTFKATPESWNWKKTDLDSSPENLADGKWVLSYANYTGSAESVVPVTVLNNTEGGENGKNIDTDTSAKEKEDFLDLLTGLEDYIENNFYNEKVTKDEQVDKIYNTIDDLRTKASLYNMDCDDSETEKSGYNTRMYDVIDALKAFADTKQY